LSTQDKVTINKLPTGVPGLDEILGGGLPEFSFNIIAGAPGSGKTTLAHQIVFANATPERPALYFTSLIAQCCQTIRVYWSFLANVGDHLAGRQTVAVVSNVIIDAHALMAGDLSCVQAHSTKTKWRRPA